MFLALRYGTLDSMFSRCSRAVIWECKACKR